jgi:hypothetical protein
MLTKKSLVYWFLSICIAISMTSSMNAQGFNDLNSGYWAYNSIQSLSEQNILTGYQDMTFKPNNPVTRAEFATMIIKALGKDSVAPSSSYDFSDVSNYFWGYGNIQRAYSSGLIKGFPDGTFRPNAYITKAEVLAILSSALTNDYMTNAEADDILKSFYDGNQVPSWAKVPVAKAVRANVAVNYPQQNFLSPQKRATRAEVAEMLFNLRSVLGIGYVPQQQAQQSTQYQNSQQQQPVNVQQVSESLASGGVNQVILRGNIATIQENSVIPTVLETSVSSELAKVGDTVIARVSQNVSTSQGTVLIPAGSKIIGAISYVEPAKFANRNASMNINFTILQLTNGQTFPLQASVATETGTIQAGSIKSNLGKGLLKTAGGAGAGAVLGTALGAITGKTGKGAIYGTAIGGGLGALGAVLQQGGAIVLPSGEPLFIKLQSPLSLDLTTGHVVP